ncbi:MAG: DUF4190 domain-containing protein [Clostridia bacterium]|nr:DUF4190 domain-containing protein [Clostridia bacterium]
MKIASIILGIVSIVLQNPISAIVGLILGIKESKISGNKTGVILNIIGLIVGILGWIILIAYYIFYFVMILGGSMSELYYYY